MLRPRNETEVQFKQMMDIAREESEEDRKERHKNVCAKCEYYGYYVGCCEYFFHTGKLRLCAPSECVKKKTFKASGKTRQVLRD